jgi:hypothetical protein
MIGFDSSKAMAGTTVENFAKNRLAQQHAAIASNKARGSLATSDATRAEIDNARSRARLGYEKGYYAPGGFRSSLDQKVLGMLGGGSNGSGTVGPQITAQGVYSPQQIQQQVNSTVAGNDQRTAGDIQGIQQSLAGQGYGGSSPLMQALMSQRQAAGAASNAQTRTDLPMRAAEMNARQLLNSQVSQENQFANRRREGIALLGQVLGLS